MADRESEEGVSNEMILFFSFKEEGIDVKKKKKMYLKIALCLYLLAYVAAIIWNAKVKISGPYPLGAQNLEEKGTNK